MHTIGCQPTTDEKIIVLPDYLMEQQQLIPLLMDMHIAEVAHQNWRYSRKRDSLPKTDSISMSIYYQNIFDLHEISPHQFAQTFAYYETHPKQFDALYTKVVEQLSRLEKKIQAQVPKTKEIQAATKPIGKPNILKLKKTEQNK